jgi:hypothetical protein
VSKALMLTGGEDVSETAKFTANFDKFFDALNVKSLTEGKHKRKDSRMPYTSVDDPRLDVRSKRVKGFVQFFLIHNLTICSG